MIAIICAAERSHEKLAEQRQNVLVEPGGSCVLPQIPYTTLGGSSAEQACLPTVHHAAYNTYGKILWGTLYGSFQAKSFYSRQPTGT